jgi:hypothetical protein
LVQKTFRECTIDDDESHSQGSRASLTCDLLLAEFSKQIHSQTRIHTRGQSPGFLQGLSPENSLVEHAYTLGDCPQLSAIQRLIICKDTNEERFDAMQKSVDGSISKEAQVIAGGEYLYWTSVQPLMEIRRIEMKNGRPMRGTRSRRLNPFTLPVATSSIVMTELTDLNVFHGRLQVIEEFELKDGRYRAYFVGNDFNRSLWSDPRRLDEPSQETSWLAPERYATVAMRTKI